MTATLTGLPQCPAHELPAYPSREAAEQEIVRRHARARLSGSPAPRLVVVGCRHDGAQWHVRPARRGAPRDLARDLVDQLRALGDVDAGLVSGTPTAECDHDHPTACPAAGAVWITMRCHLTGWVRSARCHQHAVSYVEHLLADPHRAGRVDCEVQVTTA